MKKYILGLILIFSLPTLAGPISSGGTSPFTHSGSLIQVIFESPLIWRKLFGHAEKIALVGNNRVSSDQITSVYEISTTEPVEIKNEAGAIIRWDQVACKTLVTVTTQNKDLIPVSEVTDVDFSKCPAHQK